MASLLLHIHQRVHRHLLLAGLLGRGDLDVRRVSGRVFGGQPHDHDGHHEQEIEQIPESLIHPTPHSATPSPQPLILPDLGGEIENNHARKPDQRQRRQHHRHDQQVAQPREDLQLLLLLALGEDLHGVHEGDEDPEVGDGVDATVKERKNRDEEVRTKRATSMVGLVVG